MTIKERQVRDERWLQNIAAVVTANRGLNAYLPKLKFTIENTELVVRGELPTHDLKTELVSAIRRAGVLIRVRDCLTV